MYNSSFAQAQLESSQNLNLLNDFVQKITTSNDRQIFQNSVQSFDQQLYQRYASQNYHTNSITKQLYSQPMQEAIKLNIPKQYSLADSMLRTTIGCQQKLANSYMKLIDITQQVQVDKKKKRIEQARQKFATSNSHNDFLANTKQFMNRTKFSEQRPVIQNQYDQYLKTHLKFLDKPCSGTNNKPNYSRRNDAIANKIAQLGGMQDTISPIQFSLANNEVKNLKRRQHHEGSEQKKQAKISHSPSRASLKSQKQKNNWLDKSKMLRQTLTAKLITS